jgi:RimJ/RimL family protein N-acetyltransferase
MWERPEPLPGPIETERLRIRWYWEEDAEALFQAVNPHRAAYVPWLPWGATGHQTLEQSIETIKGFEAGRENAENPDFTMGTFDRETGALLGGTGLHRIAPQTSEVEVGYWTHAEHHGKGICTEATRALITSAFEVWGFRRVILTCVGANKASQRIPEKLGIRLEGREREARWVEGIGLDDHLRFGVLKSEWDADAGQVRA